MKRSSEPTIARCSMTGGLRVLSSSTYSAPSRPGIDEIDLHRAALPGPADAVLQVILDLRAVERAFARAIPAIRRRICVERVAQRVLGLVPDSRRCRARFAGRSASFTSDVVEAEIARRPRARVDETPRPRARSAPAVQKMWPSSWVKPRTRMMPCSAPEGSLRWHEPNSP